MKMKKVLTGLVLFGATLALVACGNDAKKEDTAKSEAKTEQSSSKTADTKVMALKDGTYKGESDFDDYGWKGVHSITVKDGKIVESKFGYENKDGKMKADDEEYNKKMKAKSGKTSKEATEQLNKALVDAQDVSAVEVVTGATHTTDNFKAATEALIEAAKEGKTELVKFKLAH